MKIKIGNGDDSKEFFLTLKRAHLILSIVGLLGSCFAAAWAGVRVSADTIVPKIARAEMAPEIRQITATEATVARLAVEMDQKIREGDRATAEGIRAEIVILSANMAQLSGQITESVRIEHELLLRLSERK